MNFKLFICDDIRQEINNKLTLAGLYPDNVVLLLPTDVPQPEGLVGALGRLCLLVNVSGLTKNISIQAQFFRPDDKPHTELQDMGVQEVNGTDNLNLIFDMPFFPVPLEGTYKLHLIINDETQILEFVIKKQ